MFPKLFKKKRQALGVGLGVALAGAVALIARYGWKRVARRPPLPEALSPAIFARRLVQTSYGGMVYQICGSGEPLVFLHGIYPGASSFEWSKVYPSFVLEREVLAPDLIGFGESERPARALELDEHAEALAEFLSETCSGRPACLAASGLTSAAAVMVASRHPEKVESLILAAPCFESRPPEWSTPSLRLAARIPFLRTLLYEFFIAREPFFSSWLANSGVSRNGEFGEAIRVMTACAQQPGARHATLKLLSGNLRLPPASLPSLLPHKTTFLLLPQHTFGDKILKNFQKLETFTLSRTCDFPALAEPAEVSKFLYLAVGL